MANTKRYRPDGPWSIDKVYDAADVNVTAIIEVSDLVERYTSRRYVNGAWRVRFEGEAHPRAKSFYGETAWSDAARYADDEIHKLRMSHLGR